jgi:hypothetical protein
VGLLWVPAQHPPGNLMSNMTSIYRTSRTPGDPMNALGFHGKEGVIGSSPMEGFLGSPRYGGDFRSPLDLT